VFLCDVLCDPLWFISKDSWSKPPLPFGHLPQRGRKTRIKTDFFPPQGGIKRGPDILPDYAGKIHTPLIMSFKIFNPH